MVNRPGAHYKVLVQSSLPAVGEWRTTVSAGEAISISMRTKREEEGALQHQMLQHQWSSNANAPNLATSWHHLAYHQW